MAYVTLTPQTDGTDQVDIYDRRPSSVLIEQARNMIEVSLEKSQTGDLLTTIQDIAKAIKE